MEQLIGKGFLRVKHIIGDPEADPPIPPIFPVSAAQWWKGCADGRYPAPVKFGKMTMWRREDVLAFLASVK